MRDGNLSYRPFANEAFVDDLRTSRGVVASAGYSLMSEAVYLRKPMLALPLAGQFEQEMNARYLERLRFGTAAAALDEPALERFLDREPEPPRTLAAYSQDGNGEALAEVDGPVAGLGGRRRERARHRRARCSCTPGPSGWPGSRSRSRAATAGPSGSRPGF